MGGTCVTCGTCLPTSGSVCVWCKEWNIKMGDELTKAPRCCACQNKARKILESSGDSNAADIAWSQCEGTNHPQSPCILWAATLEANYEQMKQ